MKDVRNIQIKLIQKSDMTSIKRMLEALNKFHGEKKNAELNFLQSAFSTRLPKGYIAIHNKNAVGFSIGYDWFNFVHNTRHHHIDLFCIDKKFRHEGIGQKLLTKVIQRARARGCTIIDVNASPFNKAAQNFYKAYGFFERDKPAKRFRFIIE